MKYGLEKNLVLLEKKLLNSNRNFSPCDVCDVRGSLIGIQHADFWSKKLNDEEK